MHITYQMNNQNINLLTAPAPGCPANATLSADWATNDTC